MPCPTLQQGAFDRADPVNCNNQGDVKRWLAKYIEGGAPPPAGTTFQLPDRRETDPPTSDKRCAFVCDNKATKKQLRACIFGSLLMCGTALQPCHPREHAGAQGPGIKALKLRLLLCWCRLEVRVKTEPSLRPTRPPSARAAAVAPGGYAAVADGGVLNEVIEQEAREAR